MTANALGIDIGGTNTRLALVAMPEGRILERIDLATPPREDSGVWFLDELVPAARTLTPAAAVGIGICELVSREGTVTSAHRVDWTGLSLGEAFGGLPLLVESDVRAAALAEARFGAGRGFADFVYVNAGTGLSSCWVRDGVPHAGAHGAALVLGSGPLPFHCPRCGAHADLAPEETAGAGAVLSAYRGGGGAAASVRVVLERANGGDTLARAVVAKAAVQAGAAAGWLVNVLDPQAVVAGGGLVAAGGFYWEAFLEGLHLTRWSGGARELPVLQAGLGADAGVIGAALAAHERFR